MNSSIIIISIACYLVAALVTAWLSRAGKATSMSSYFLGNRQMGGVVSALSYSATTYSAFMMVGLAGLTYAGGIGAYGFEIVYFAGVSLVAVFGPRFWAVGHRYGFISPNEMLAHRYNSKAVAIATTLVSCLFLLPYSAVQLAGIGYLLSGMTGGSISFTTGTVLATALALIFTWISGIRSVMWTDALQALFMIVASTLVVFFVLDKMGGVDELFATITENHPKALSVPGTGTFGFLTFLGLTIPWFFFSLTNPQVSQRLFMPESLSALRRMLLIFLCFGLVYTMVSVFWGLSALAIFPDLSSPDLATPSLLASEYVPPVLGVIVMIGIFAAAVSTIDSIMLTLASMVSRDVFANLSPKSSELAQLRVSQLVIPVIALLAFGFAELRLDLIAVLAVAASTGLVVAVPAIIGAFFWRRGTAAGVLVSVLVTGAAVLFSQLTGFTPLGVPAGIWGLFLATALYVGTSLVTHSPGDVADEFIACSRDWRSAGRRARAGQHEAEPDAPSDTSKAAVS